MGGDGGFGLRRGSGGASSELEDIEECVILLGLELRFLGGTLGRALLLTT